MKQSSKFVRGMGAAVLISTCLFAARVYADALNRRVRIHNNSSFIMTRLHASHVGRNGWEEDILGSGILAPGRNIAANIDDGSGYCRYDLRAVFSTGAEVVRWNVDVCTVAHWYIFDHTNVME
jgi:hypothetical protein